MTIFVHNYVQIKQLDMLIATLSSFRKDIKKYFDDVINNFETIIINRGSDNGVVIISLDEYNSLRTTQHELSSKKNIERLDSALEKFDKGRSVKKNLIEE